MTRTRVTPGSVLEDFKAIELRLWSAGILSNVVQLACVADNDGWETVESPCKSRMVASVRHLNDTVGEHLTLLRQQAYTLLLFDGAFVQVVYSFKRRELMTHRLAYYPYPLRANELFDEGFYADEILEAFSPEEQLRRLRRCSPIRFDYDREAGTDDHFESHLTLSSKSCRIPVTHPLGIGHFLRFVVEHFYDNLSILPTDLPCHGFDPVDRNPQPDQLFLSIGPATRGMPAESP